MLFVCLTNSIRWFLNSKSPSFHCWKAKVNPTISNLFKVNPKVFLGRKLPPQFDFWGVYQTFMFLGCRDGFQHLSCRQSWTGCCEVAQTVHEDALLLLGGDKAYVGTSVVSGDMFHVAQVSRSVQFRLSWSYSPNLFGLRKTWVGDHPYHFDASFTRLWKVAFQNSWALSCLIHSSSNVLVMADFWGRSANQKALVLDSWVLNRMSWCCCGAQKLAGQDLLIDPKVFVSFGANLSWVFVDILIDL